MPIKNSTSQSVNNSILNFTKDLSYSQCASNNQSVVDEMELDELKLKNFQ